jgi:hypothetical protein
MRPAPPPKTNAERQQAFRERNPDYCRLLQRRRRAKIKEGAARLLEAHRLEQERLRALYVAAINPPMPLMLPAPVETSEIPGMTIPLIQRELVPLQAQAPSPSPAAKRHAA